MNNYADIYSEHGLNQMIENNLKKIEEKKKDIIEVKAGRKWNPLCKEGNIKELEDDIRALEHQVKAFEEALLIQKSRKLNS